MLCPVCKTECGNDVVCANCGFEQLQVEFLSREEATHWMNRVVIPYREKWQTSQMVTKIDWEEILFCQKDIRYFFNVTIPAATSKNAPLGHTLLVCPYPRFLDAFAELLAKAIPYRNIKKVEDAHKMKMGDIWDIFTNLNESDVCIQKIKTIPTDAESAKHFQTALKGFFANILIGKGPGAREVHLDLPTFTFFAVADKTSEVPKKYLPLFENVIELKFDKQEACRIEIRAAAAAVELRLHQSALELIALETNHDANEAANCVKHINDFMLVKGLDGQVVTEELAKEILSQFM